MNTDALSEWAANGIWKVSLVNCAGPWNSPEMPKGYGNANMCGQTGDKSQCGSIQEGGVVLSISGTMTGIRNRSAIGRIYPEGECDSA